MSVLGGARPGVDVIKPHLRLKEARTRRHLCRVKFRYLSVAHLYEVVASC